MNRFELTEAARRAIERAETLAAKLSHHEAGPLHLLHGLLSEESQAWELLHRHGLTVDVLNAKLSVGPLDAAVSNRPVDELTTEEIVDALTATFTEVMAGVESAEQPAPSVDPAPGSVLDELLQSARSVARSDGRAASISTEHLLAAIVRTPSPTADLLAEHGISAESLATANRSDSTVEPVAVSFEIDCSESSPTEQLAVCRILDAAANRAREGLRVVEDYVRFTLDDAHLSELLKQARHQLRSVMQQFDASRLLQARDTQADVGTAIQTPQEMSRASLLDVVKASLKRAQEATRTLEEYAKVSFDRDAPERAARAAAQLEQLRYRLYTLEKAVLTAVDSRQRLAGRHLYLLLTCELCRIDPLEVLRAAIIGGVGVVQIREKSMRDRELLDWARRVRDVIHGIPGPGRPLLIINDRPDLAVLARADGVHVGQEELSVRSVRQIVGPDLLVGVSTHSIDQARQAVLDGAGYLGVGPVFPTSTKSFQEFAGLDFVREVAAGISLPWYPIGGIHSGNIQQVTEAGATRVAVSGAICASPAPQDTATGLAAFLDL